MPLFDIISISTVTTTMYMHRMLPIFIFFKSFQTKKIRHLQPKMSKIAWLFYSFLVVDPYFFIRAKLVRGRRWFVKGFWKIRCMLRKAQQGAKRPLDEIGSWGRCKPPRGVRGNFENPKNMSHKKQYFN